MSSGAVTIQNGYHFGETEVVTIAKLNKMIEEAVLRVAAGAITNRELADGTITADKLAAEIAAQLGLQDGTVTTAKVVDDAITNAKLADMPALTVKCREVNSAGNPGDLQFTVEEQILMRRGNVLVADVLSAAQISAGKGIVNNATGVKVYFGSTTVTILAGFYWSAGVTVNFPAAFASAASFSPFVTLVDINASLPGDTAYTIHADRTAATGMTVFAHRTNNPASAVIMTFCWMAIGT